MSNNRQNTFLGDPLVVEPAGFDVASAWAKTQREVARLRAAGRDFAAAAIADPGICYCPDCGSGFWAWGAWQRCRLCGFEYPTDWWSMYREGIAAAKSGGQASIYGPVTRERHEAHPYYRYGFEHPVADPDEERYRIDWRAVMGPVGRGAPAGTISLAEMKRLNQAMREHSEPLGGPEPFGEAE